MFELAQFPFVQLVEILLIVQFEVHWMVNSPMKGARCGMFVMSVKWTMFVGELAPQQRVVVNIFVHKIILIVFLISIFIPYPF